MFIDDVKRGKIAEVACARWLKEKGWKVQDVSGDKVLQKTDDTDLIIEKNGEIRTIEVKYDYYTKKTRNMFLEYVTNVERKSDGYMKKSKAEYLFYCVQGEEKAYCFRLQDIRELADRKNLPYIQKYIGSKEEIYRLLNIDDAVQELEHLVFNLPTGAAI